MIRIEEIEALNGCTVEDVVRDSGGSTSLGLVLYGEESGRVILWVDLDTTKITDYR